MVAVPVRDERPAAAGPLRSEAELFETYQLESALGGQAVSSASEHLYFRYDPTLRKDTEFFLWYLCAAPGGRAQPAWRRLAVVVRWSAADGTHLVWRSRRMFLDLRAAPYWRPLFLEPPIFPRGCDWVRFDVVTDGGDSPDPLCTGFLFRPRDDQTEASDVLALGRLPNDGANPGEPGRPLEEIGRGCRAWPIDPSEPPGGDISILAIDRLAGLEALYFVGWSSLGRTLVGVRLPTGKLPMPPALALPRAGWSAPRAQIYGYGSATGFVALSWQSRTEPAGR
jgi:hypothetical protein